MASLTTVRAIRHQVQNALDYLFQSELALYLNPVSMIDRRVSWHSPSPSGRLVSQFDHPTVDQYVEWVTAGQYSAVLFDASLLQLTFEVKNGTVVGHRLLYFPCPFKVETEWLASGEALADVIAIYRDQDAQLRSPIRFDYDPSSAAPGHPAAHLTINGVDCRIACIAPLHIMRFLNFVFQNFYSDLWAAHSSFFEEGRWQHIGKRVLAPEDLYNGHFGWDVNATASSAAAN